MRAPATYPPGQVASPAGIPPGARTFPAGALRGSKFAKARMYHPQAPDLWCEKNCFLELVCKCDSHHKYIQQPTDIHVRSGKLRS